MAPTKPKPSPTPESEPDGFSFAFESLPPEQPLINPGNVAAEIVLRRALQAYPDLHLPAGAGLAVMIEVPGANWVDPIAAAWQAIATPPNTDYLNGDTTDWRYFPSPMSGRWVQFKRNGSGGRRGASPADGNDAVAAALAAGGSSVGISQAPHSHLPRDLLRVADHRIVVPPLCTDILAEIVATLTASATTEAISNDLARLCDMSDICLAYRPGETAEAFLGRLRRLISDRHQMAPLLLEQLAGMDEATEWGLALARDMAEYRAGRLPWSAVDRGCLLYGPPGTGKTTFAKALAGSSGIPLISASLGQWQAAGHLGDLLKAMRMTFDAARAAAPAVLFIDEIDGFGNRISFRSEYRDYSVQVVNGLLELLDGINDREGVVVVGACNHPDRLDPALVRSGRLDRRILIPLPDQPALARIIRHHLGQDLEGADLAQVAKLAFGSTGADVEKWVRGARRRARTDKRVMTIDDLVAEIRGNNPLPVPAQLRRNAIHEAGHALVLALHHPEMLVQASIRQTSTTGGRVTMDLGNFSISSRTDIEFLLLHLLAGRAAEDVILGSISSGAGGDMTSDLARATSLAATSLMALGFNDEMPLLWFGMPSIDGIGTMFAGRPDLARKVSTSLDLAYAKARNVIQQHSAEIERIAALLLEKETLDGDEILEAITKRRPEPAARLAPAELNPQRPATPACPGG